MPMTSCDIGGPNKYCFPESATAWHGPITVKHPSIIKPLAGVTSPHTLYVVPCRPPNSQAVALSEVLPQHRGWVYLPTPGDYYVNVPVQGSAAGDTCFVVIDAGSPEGAVAMIQMAKEAPVLLVNAAGLTADLANADGAPDFSKTLIGLLTNSRVSQLRQSSDEWIQLSCDLLSAITGEGHGTWPYTRVGAALLGRESAGNTVNAIEARNADANGDFTKTLIGLLANSRLSAYQGSAADWSLLGHEILTTITGEAHGSQTWLRAAAAAFGRDTGDNTVRAIEARAATAGQAVTLYRLLADSSTRGYDLNSTLHELVSADIISNFLTGRDPSGTRGLWANAVAVRYNTQGPNLLPTPTDRSVATVNGALAVGAVVATLDCQAMVNKDCYVTAAEVSTVDVQISSDGVTWITIVAAFATAVGTVFPLSTALLLDRVKPWRFLRIIAGAAGFAAATTGVIQATGD